jgi:hypothetical protein
MTGTVLLHRIQELLMLVVPVVDQTTVPTTKLSFWSLLLLCELCRLPQRGVARSDQRDLLQVPARTLQAGCEHMVVRFHPAAGRRLRLARQILIRLRPRKMVQDFNVRCAACVRCTPVPSARVRQPEGMSFLLAQATA